MLKAFKHFLMTSLLLVLSQTAVAGTNLRDRPVPWPWGLEQPFPWGEIQGIWRTPDDVGIPVSYFSFKVVNGKKKSAVKQLLVTQIDGYTCNVIATGVGIELHDVMRAQMITSEHANEPGVTFRLSLRAFALEASPEPRIGRLTSQVMVLSITDLDRDPTKNLHIQIGKTSAKVGVKDCVAEKINF
jgi:hypothetical protein